MSVITLKKFGGIAGKMAPSKLPPDMAQIATNCKLWSGDLRAFRGASELQALVKTGAIQTIYRYNNDTDFLEWTEDVNVARASVAGDTTEKIVFTGTDLPRITTNVLYDDVAANLRPASYKLGIPKPTDDPTAVSGGAGVLTGAYAWVYTYVRTWPDGTTDEGPPSDAASFTAAGEDVDLTLPNAGAPIFADYGITHKRIYRAIGGTYKFIAEVTAATTTYTDNTADADAGEDLETVEYLSPPDTAKGAIFLENGVIALFDQNVLLLSDPYRAHAYPQANRYTLPFPIVGLGQIGTMVIVCTTAYTWRFSGASPDAMTPYRYAARFPCKSKRSIVSDQYGVRYVSDHGIVQVTPSEVALATKQLEDQDSWWRYIPETVHAQSYADGRYIGFYKTGESSGIHTGGGFLLDQSVDPPILVDLGYYAYAAYAPPESNTCYVVQKADGIVNTVYEWDTDDTAYLEYTYRSKIFPMTADDVFVFGLVAGEYEVGLTPAEQAAYTAARNAIIAANQALLNDLGDDTVGSIEIGGEPTDPHVEVGGNQTGFQDVPPAAFTAGEVSFKLYANGSLVATKLVTDDEPFVLTNFDLALEYEIEVTGQVPVREASVAGDLEEMAQI